jgi:hypothetical protein
MTRRVSLRRRFLAALAGLLTGAGFLLAAAPAVAEGPTLPGMCNGRSDELVVVTAHAVGQQARSSAKFVLNLATDAVGHPSGVLVAGQGSSRLEVDEWCRLWQHIPGTPTQGQCQGDPEGAVIVHAVGVSSLRDGTRILVRVDARGTEDGEFYRLRYKPMGGGHEGEEGHTPGGGGEDGHTPGGGDEGGCGDDEGWTRVPAEGWAPLTLLKVRPA